MSTAPTYDQLLNHTREIAVLESTSAALQWDEHTYMPEGGRDYRADQLTQLAGMIHAKQIDPQRGQWLDELIDSNLAEDRHSDTGATIHRLMRDYKQALRLPQTLVEAMTRATVVGQQRWQDARAQNDFQSFLPALSTIVELKREAAALMSDGGEPYDALLDEYEEGAKSADLEPMFQELRAQLVPLVKAIDDAKPPEIEVLKREYPIEAQRRIGARAAEAIGFDFHRGRLDETAHPFCTSLGPSDTRILTRYDAHWFPGAFFGTLHEAGHGMYDQGLPQPHYGLPLGTFSSLGIHESQSRLWENMVGRGKAFWEYFFPEVQTCFPKTLPDVSLDTFHAAINHVSSSLIRVEADEVTYNLHIIIRFELERMLIGGSLSPQELPEAWNAKYQEYLGIEPDSDANGVLQDVHWGAGLIGYFPTYTLGNLIAAQLYEAAEHKLGDLDNMFRQGEFQPLLDWLRESVHEHGRRYTPTELVQIATGREVAADALVGYLKSKYEQIYNLGSL